MDRIERVMRAMPATRRQIRDSTGMTKGSVQRVIENLHAAGWLHVCGHVRELVNDTVKFTEVLAAGHGQDQPCDLTPMTQKERDRRRYEKLVETGGIAQRAASGRQSVKAKRLRRKQQLAAWAAPLTTKIARRKPSKTFPEAVERDNA